MNYSEKQPFNPQSSIHAAGTQLMDFTIFCSTKTNSKDQGPVL